MKASKRIYIEDIDFFDFLLDLETDATKKSIPNLVEGHVFNSILKTCYARRFAKNMQKRGLNYAFACIFDEIAAGLNWKSKHCNTRKVVEYAGGITLSLPNWTADKRQREAILRYMEQLKSRVDLWLTQNKPNAQADFEVLQQYDDYAKLSEWIEDLWKMYKSNFDLFAPTNIFAVILDGWDLFLDWTITYRLLSAVESTMIGATYSKNICWTSLQLINKMTSEWDN